MKIIKKQPLYSKDAHGTIRYWSIELVETPDSKYELHINHGVYGGDLQTNTENIDFGLAARTTYAQALSRFESRVNKKIDSGYVRNYDDAVNKKKTNALGLPKPMLAQKYRDVYTQIPWNSGVYAQRKYNGHRCLIAIIDGIPFAYTRGGKEITAITSILKDIENLELPNGTILDGELYCHGEKLQTISSWAKKKQPNTELLTYMVYDVVLFESFPKRNNFIKNLKLDEKTEKCKEVETYLINSESEALEKMRGFMEDGFEGAMLRAKLGGYEDGKRSKTLIKMKKAMDGEFKIVGIKPSSEGWAILECVADNGEKFDCSAPGTKDQKFEIMQNKEKYIGKFINISYFEKSIRGVPMQLTANHFMDDVTI